LVIKKKEITPVLHLKNKDITITTVIICAPDCGHKHYIHSVYSLSLFIHLVASTTYC